jgi:hypothetical protein
MLMDTMSHPSQSAKGEPSVRVVVPTALDTLRLHARLCRWYEDRKELWNDKHNGLDSRDPARG